MDLRTQRTMDLPLMDLRTDRMPSGEITYWVEPDGDGLPLIYHHGMPSAGQCSPALRRAALAAGFTLIQPVRPGYGTASAEPGYTIAGFGRRSAELARSRADRFAVIGLSAGGPFSLATAAAGADATIGAGVIAGIAPLHEDIYIDDAEREEAAKYIALAKDRDSVASALKGEAANMLADLDDGLTQFRSSATGLDAESLTPERLAAIAASLAWTFSVGIDGYVDDAIAVYREWGFDLTSISCPVHLHYGTADEVVPVHHGEAVRQRLKTATMHIHPDHGHTSISGHSYAPLTEWLASLK